MVFNALEKVFDLLMISIILLNLSQRKMPHTIKKRRASLIWAAYFLLLYILLFIRNYYSWPSYTEWIFLALLVIPVIVFRKTFWPFKAHCVQCGKRLSFSQIIGRDENYCTSCFNQAFPEEAEKEERNRKKKETEEENFTNADKIEDINWDQWEPTERCVLTYLFDDDKVLLIHKKKGLGTGYINAPGGHIELEETKVEAARRETKEETGLEVGPLKEMGELRFQFKDGLRMLGYVFFSYSYSGSLIKECEETKPFWSKIEDLDYSKMWEDDKLWLPRALKGEHFDGKFIFDGKRLVDSQIIFEADYE